MPGSESTKKNKTTRTVKNRIAGRRQRQTYAMSRAEFHDGRVCDPDRGGRAAWAGDGVRNTSRSVRWFPSLPDFSWQMEAPTFSGSVLLWDLCSVLGGDLLPPTIGWAVMVTHSWCRGRPCVCYSDWQHFFLPPLPALLGQSDCERATKEKTRQLMCAEVRLSCLPAMMVGMIRFSRITGAWGTFRQQMTDLPSLTPPASSVRLQEGEVPKSLKARVSTEVTI